MKVEAGHIYSYCPYDNKELHNIVILEIIDDKTFWFSYLNSPPLKQGGYNSKVDCELIAVPLDEYEELNDDADFLNCLRMRGVDNWQGYEEACRTYREDDNESN